MLPWAFLAVLSFLGLFKLFLILNSTLDARVAWWLAGWLAGWQAGRVLHGIQEAWVVGVSGCVCMCVCVCVCVCVCGSE